MKSGIELIAQERQEQLEKHKRTVDHDAAFNTDNQLLDAASVLSMDAPQEILDFHKDDPPIGWNEETWSHMLDKPYVERLTIAGALIAAEIDRVQFFQNY